VVCLAVALILGAAAPAAAVAEPIAGPSDPRAEFVEGNATTCAQVGFAGAIRLGGDGAAEGADAYVSATTRQQRYVDVTITAAGAAAGVVIDAVVVKGGNAFNLYANPAVLPPALAPPQGYFSPYVGAGNVPQISHWFVCYHFDAPPTGSLALSKQVIPPAGVPVQSLPTTFDVLVSCDAPGFQPVLVTFGLLGGVALDAANVLIEDLPIGTTCTLDEQDTGAFPSGATVSFDPAATVQIAGSTGTSVSVINDFSGIAILQGSLTITKVVEASQSAVPDEFSVEYACLDGTAGTITVPGTGGASAPIVTSAGTYCAIAEAPGSRPPGWTVLYEHEQQTSTTGLIVPVFETPVTVTVTNTAPVPGPSPTDPTDVQPDGPVLADGGGVLWPGWAVLGAALLLGGVVFLLSTRVARRR
jgi:hypothetical protein